ncbi:MAG TPA: class I SAM-dependent methyltransferase [Solirubrobacterales bacterium]|nr:class I SAM-dependent methyltransferase [Solirubrobacterales bacterium]
MSRVTLPPRYSAPWRGPFDDPITERLTPGCAVLDIGSGRHPAIRPDDRPESVRYVGLDLSRDELDAAGEAAYTETVAADATSLRPELTGRFDLVISWQVLEHVRDLEATVGNIREYLKPGGLFVALFSGSWSAFGVINRVLPDRIGSKLVDRAMKRTERNIPVFPAHYDRCSQRALVPLFAEWDRARIEPLYNGAGYFAFAPPLQRVYLAYENLIERRRVANLATHYLVVAER